MRIGHSIDIHPFDEEKELILGGVKLPGRGLKGHSDADVLLHAITESIFGALAMGDMGTHFPDTDERWKGQDSSAFVVYAVDKLSERNCIISNLDCMIIAEEPKLSPYIEKIRKRVAELLLIQISQVSIKATTAEGLGFLGNREGILASATILLEEV